jgi:hypothetical protein
LYIDNSVFPSINKVKETLIVPLLGLSTVLPIVAPAGPSFVNTFPVIGVPVTPPAFSFVTIGPVITLMKIYHTNRTRMYAHLVQK